MIACLFGILAAATATSVDYLWLPADWQIPLALILIVYLFRFRLHRLGWATAWWSGFWLDAVSTGRFGLWLLICLSVAALADGLWPTASSRARPNLDWGLVGLASGLTAAGLAAAASGRWLSAGFGSAFLTSIFYLAAANLTIRWRLYE